MKNELSRKSKKANPQATNNYNCWQPRTGKTSLGALFPSALILPTEDGTSVFENWDEDIQPAVLPRLPKSFKG